MAIGRADVAAVADGDGTQAEGLPTVVLVDDAVEVRTLVRTRLRMSHAVAVVGEGSTGHEAVDIAQELQPDLMLLDVSMPGMDGLEALPGIRSASPETRVVMYSGFEERGLAERALTLGAAAFFEKSTSLDTLADDLLTVLGSGGPGGPRPQRVRAGPATTVEPVIREHLERFREVFEDAAIGMATMTLSGRIVRANRSLARLFARPVNELVAASYAELAGPEADALDRAVTKVVAGDRDAVQVEHGISTDDPSASSRRLLATVSSVRDAADRPLYLFLQVQDVSAQREAEQELQLSEERFRLLVEAVQDYAIFMLDPDGRISSWNAGAQRIKGWTAEEIVGRHFRTFYPPEKQAERHPEHELELAVRDGHYEEEGWRVRKDGSMFWARVTITAVRDRAGQLVGFAKVTRDITDQMGALAEQTRAADALAEANLALESANGRLSRAADDQSHFLAVTAHELRSPVGVLGGSASLLRRHWADLDDPQREELLEGMESSAVRLQRLVDDLLTASRIRNSALQLDVGPVGLRRALERIVASTAPDRGTGTVTVDVPDDVTIAADADRFAQMVENLVANALRHGSPPVMIGCEVRDTVVDVTVRDSGAGVPDSMRGRLFERFATASDGGTGLGLYIVRALARAQGGEASYRAEDGAFVVTLPLADPNGSQGGAGS